MAVKVIVDAFGGDHAPLEVIRGCERAVRELGVSIILTGSEQKIKACATENGISLEGMEIVHTDDVFDIHEEPKELIKSGKNTSMAVGLTLLAENRGGRFHIGNCGFRFLTVKYAGDGTPDGICVCRPFRLLRCFRCFRQGLRGFPGSFRQTAHGVPRCGILNRFLQLLLRIGAAAQDAERVAEFLVEAFLRHQVANAQFFAFFSLSLAV